MSDEGRDITRMPRGNRKSSRGKTSIINGREREGSSQGRRKVFQFPVNGTSNQLLVGFLSVVMMKCSEPEEFTESTELLNTIGETHKIGCKVSMVCHQEFLQVQGKGIMKLSD